MKNFIKNWFTGTWNIYKVMITAIVGLGLVLGIILLLKLTPFFLPILGGILGAGGVVGIIQMIRRGFKGDDKVNNVMLTLFFTVIVILGVYLIIL